ncbi:MAG: acyl-CoA thioesterase [Hyphomicrobiaceae bacterium]
MPTDVAKAAPDLRDRGIFRAWTKVSVRYNDLDPLGHVNNAALGIFLEEARCQLIAPLIKAHGRHLDMVLAATSMQYLKEMHYPGEVEVGMLCTRLGTKSFSLAHGVFQDGVCTGTAELTLVCFDLDRRVTVEPKPDVRAYLESLRA